MNIRTSLGSVVASLAVAGGLFAGIGAVSQVHAAASIAPVHSNPFVHHGIARILPDPTCTGNCYHTGPLAELIVSRLTIRRDRGAQVGRAHIVPDPTGCGASCMSHQRMNVRRVPASIAPIGYQSLRDILQSVGPIAPDPTCGSSCMFQ
jgi:hypothetical protein